MDPVIAAGVIALMGNPIPSFVAALALAFGFVPKIIDFVKSIFGLNKDVDKEIKNEEKGLKGEKTKEDATIEKEEKEAPPPPPEQQEEAEKMNKGGMVPDKNVTKMNQGGEVLD